jgi:serine protease Do
MTALRLSLLCIAIIGLGASAPAEPAPKATTAAAKPATPAPGWYAVHPVQPTADRLGQALAMLGNVPALSTVPGPDGRTALVVGPFGDEAEALSAMETLNQRGVPVMDLARCTEEGAPIEIVRWRVTVGEPLEPQDARALAARPTLAKHGKPGYIESGNGRVQVALTFPTSTTAEAAMRELARTEEGTPLSVFTASESLFAEAAPAPPAIAAPPPPAAPASPVPADDRVLVAVAGGGEVVGRIAKETAEALFIDIGPEIIRVPVASVQRRTKVSGLRAGESIAAGTSGSSGMFDPSTGSVVFTVRKEAPDTRTRAQVLDDAKRSIVIVSNVRGRGSGWVIDTEGRVVTNHHVIGNEKLQTVTLFVKRGDQWERVKFEDCEVEAFSSYYDIAIVRIPREKLEKEGVTLYPVEIAPPDSLEAGDAVFAIGNPGMGGRLLEHTISEGVVSSLARNFSDVLYIQTTAPVNPGNSGGPLLDTRGRVVGLITSKATFAEGIAFALPVPLIRIFLDHSQAFAFSERSQNRGYRYLPPE